MILDLAHKSLIFGTFFNILKKRFIGEVGRAYIFHKTIRNVHAGRFRKKDIIKNKEQSSVVIFRRIYPTLD